MLSCECEVICREDGGCALCRDPRSALNSPLRSSLDKKSSEVSRLTETFVYFKTGIIGKSAYSKFRAAFSEPEWTECVEEAEENLFSLTTSLNIPEWQHGKEADHENEQRSFLIQC